MERRTRVRRTRPRASAARTRCNHQNGEGGTPVIEVIVFIAASLMVIGGALGVVLRSNPVHAALSLVLTLFGVAVHFVSMEAHFLAAVQVIVYAGAIVVLFLFVIMLLGVDKVEDLRTEPMMRQRYLGPLVGVGVLGLVGTAVIVARGRTIVQSVEGLDTVGHDANVKQLARSLFSDYVFAFELTSVLLVIAVVGTVLLARRPNKGLQAAREKAGVNA
ncbi:MAG: NADH-quinone oxidoreductase subunit J [Actinobacteria bacterium]|nr:NADH-quinone oxidoreductase subunit J [Actinomycetota bacterium]MSY13840.1 NADH-quinone oxidoreductase subunit J [Actinomycetota bacterium]MSZ05051.1 NADH-quinone oxidoreductase subunit J [Actinomycetota bacterium]MTB06745.1 NADH-quinone oxidoreductase subunit J [Actinomycetota bacterium]